ncbi:class A beta-lactamase BOR-1 [Luteimonas pelagia]
MPIDHARRRLVTASLATFALVPMADAWAIEPPLPSARPRPLDALAALERRHGGRLGVAILDTVGGRRINHRGEERFPMCSTFKWLAAAHVLARVDRGEESLERRIRYGRDDLVSYSPVTEHHVDTGMTVGELCDAAITLSDNTAGNLLLASAGGPAGLTAFARGIGDTRTRLDRWETELNEAAPGDPRDTTTPASMLHSMREVLLGDVLADASRTQLVDWLVATRTGDRRLRAGLPGGWRVGDKTGTSGNGIANDVGIAWPPGRGPLLVTAYYDGRAATPEQRDAVIADVGRVVASLAGAGVAAR